MFSYINLLRTIEYLNCNSKHRISASTVLVLLVIFRVYLSADSYRVLNPVLKKCLRFSTEIPCAGMQCIKTKVLGNRCAIKHAFWPYIDLDSRRILAYQSTATYILLESE